MQLRLLILSFLSFFLIAQTAFSQPICGFDLKHQQRLKADPEYGKKLLKSEDNIRHYIATHKDLLSMRVNGINTALYTIPVVVHIVHTGGAIGTLYNPTDAQVTDAINYLNQVYNGTNPGTEGVGDLQIQFVLAQRDPNCNPTNGINRIDGSGLSGYTAEGVNYLNSTGASQTDVKDLIRWHTTDYYNVWIVNKIDGADGTSGTFIAGFATFPPVSPPDTLVDGIIMLATQMKAGQKTLPHELGHAFNLYHPFAGSIDKTHCPPNANCSLDGDQVCDTDPITYNQLSNVFDFTCRTGTNGCTGTPYDSTTEHNYMNYTSCYNLFTIGQKSRMLAAAAAPYRINLSTSLGATATTDATNPCPPKINFESTEGQAMEATAANSGCRSYKDYTYNLTIGNDPNQAATATLDIAGGTATEGVDFDITTNGSFSSPSKTLNFPAGSNGNQSFTIRIYDDASVESSETFTLGFTVNNGGGNAVQGDGRANLLFTINDNDVAPYGPFTTTQAIGPNLGSLLSPFAGASTKQRSQIMYLASEMTANGMKAGNILGLSLNIIKSSSVSFVYQGLTIRMAQTTQGSVYNGTTESPLGIGALTTVYNGNYTTVNGLNSFNFATPFAWDGVSNIIVDFCYDSGGATSANDNCQVYVDGSSAYTYVFQPNINCASVFGGFGYYNSTTGIKPNIQFTYTDPGTPVQTVLNSSKQEYLGPNADVYFYDQSTSKLMARISNSTAFDYGCTQVFIDRNTTSAGSNSVAFWNNTPANYLLSKTIKVVPTTNNPSGSYQVSLYYTQAEVNAWQTATGQSISNAQLIKVASQISDVTPANPSGGGTVTIATPAITSVGTNTVLTASFTNGFSGFGAGVAGSAALPVHLLDFTGRLIANSALLEWSTSSEINSRYFDIERSADGIVFNKMGTVNAAGNSSITHNYSFTDAAPPEHNYYRLKQVDIDGKFEYSKVIIIDNKNYGGNFRVINNPFTDVLDIDFGKAQAGKTDVRLLDVTGKEIYHTVNDVSGLSRLHINLSGRNLSAGIYLLQVNTNHGQFIARVMKQ